jgi:antitoxin component of RelBE/YafQ-DinJ toxin-antitoxin module
MELCVNYLDRKMREMHVGAILKRIVNEMSEEKRKIASDLGLTYQAMFKVFNKETIDTKKIVLLSKSSGVNVFRILADEMEKLDEKTKYTLPEDFFKTVNEPEVASYIPAQIKSDDLKESTNIFLVLDDEKKDELMKFFIDSLSATKKPQTPPATPATPPKKLDK